MQCRRARSVYPLIVGLVAAGCGNAETSTTAAVAPPATTAPPATVVFVPGPGTTVRPVAPVDVTEPCPVSDPSAAGPEMMDEAARLEPMLGQVLAYGQAHPDVWGSYGLVWLGAGDASVFVSFTNEIADHRQALVEQVALPDELIVCQSPITGADAQALQAQLSRELAGRFASIGVGASGTVEVVLLPGEEPTASELIAQYGDAVDVTFGEVDQVAG